MKTTTAIISLIVLSLLLALPAASNNLILIPTGTTLTTGQVRAEAAMSVNGSDSQYYWLGTGLQQFELNVTRFQKSKIDAENVVDIQWSFIPETMLTPAVAFGVNDLAAQSEQGVGPYVVVTRHLPLPEASTLLKSFAATTGVGVLGLRGPFFGFKAELPANLVLEGEYDSRDFNGAVGWQPTKSLMLKAYTIRKQTYVGAELVPITF